jgi:hypothetical protein
LHLLGLPKNYKKKKKNTVALIMKNILKLIIRVSKISLVSFYFIYSILAPPTPSQFSSTTAVPSNKNFSPTLMLHHHRKTLPP